MVGFRQNMLKSWCMKSKQGITLIELLLSITLLSIIASFAWPFFSTIKSNSLDSDIIRIVQGLREARTSAQTLKDDSSWGLIVQKNQATLFPGDSYHNRKKELETIFHFSKGVTSVNQQEIIFRKYEGSPSFIGKITLQYGNLKHDININDLGLISY